MRSDWGRKCVVTHLAVAPERKTGPDRWQACDDLNHLIDRGELEFTTIHAREMRGSVHSAVLTRTARKKSGFRLASVCRISWLLYPSFRVFMVRFFMRPFSGRDAIHPCRITSSCKIIEGQCPAIFIPRTFSLTKNLPDLNCISKRVCVDAKFFGRTHLSACTENYQNVKYLGWKLNWNEILKIVCMGEIGETINQSTNLMPLCSLPRNYLLWVFWRKSLVDFFTSYLHKIRAWRFSEILGFLGAAMLSYCPAGQFVENERIYPINQSVERATDQSINQSVCQSVNQ